MGASSAPSPLWEPLAPTPLWVWWNWRGRITIKGFAKAISELGPLTLSRMVWHVVGDMLFYWGTEAPQTLAVDICQKLLVEP